tara:strand:+ start:4363 stop:5076 length:714 start_codon:yes stop_codon:yes gene_type:complete
MANEIKFNDIWATLSKIDCSDKIEKKMNLSYLSWAWAWGVVMDNYPEAEYRFYEQAETGVPYIQFPDGTAEVRCRIQIGECVREMWLPVMDYKNNAIATPNSRQVSDTKMRCLVKCLAMFGLGHYIYAGEDLPRDEMNLYEEPVKSEPKKKVVEKKPVEKKESTDWKEVNTPESASIFTEGFMTIVEQLNLPEEVTEQWKANKEELIFLKDNHPEIYEQLSADCNKHVTKLKEEKNG